MNETLSSILQSAIPAAVTAAVGYLIGKRKNNAEASSSELDNVEKALVIYRGMIQDLNTKIKELEAHVERLEKIVEEYKQKFKP